MPGVCEMRQAALYPGTVNEILPPEAVSLPPEPGHDGVSMEEAGRILGRVLWTCSATLWWRADGSCAGLSGRSFRDGADLVREDRERGRG